MCPAPRPAPRPSPPPRRPARALGFFLAAALAGAALRPAGAQLAPTPVPVLEFGDVQMNANVFLFGNLVAEDPLQVPHGSPGIVNVLYQDDFELDRFPATRSVLTDGFASALMTSGGLGGAGVSFWSPHTPNLSAQALWAQSVRNVGGSTAILAVDYSLPEIEASILAGPSYAFHPGHWPYVRATARLEMIRYLADGTALAQETVFDYSLTLERWGRGSDISYYVVTRSADLRHDMGDGDVVRVNDVTGIRYRPYEGSRHLPNLQPGERMFLVYLFDVQAKASQTDTPELGYQGLVGDPFDVHGGGLTVRLVSPTAVPEPGTLALAAAGLAALLAGARRRPRR